MEDLDKVPDISDAKAAIILSAIEHGRRRAEMKTKEAAIIVDNSLSTLNFNKV
jgi:hypothetical protein